ncbi:MAG: protein kinase, partial [Candidatus Hydrogenedentes bacterium]|nr:protein kinase [Candidatus Hydrogenedentota bacterium]
MSEPEMPQRLGRYEILKKLGRGAMGIVYEGRDPNIGRRVAIKTARRDLMEAAGIADEMKQRFLREAQVAGALSHPNIITIYDADEEDGIAYIAMEFLEGGNLQDLIDAQERLSPQKIVKIGAMLCKALSVVHAQGIIHRDIKPANILTVKGDIKLTDFGIAHVSNSSLTHTGARIGTPAYMSPEQIQGITADRRSDLFSVAVVLYELLTGEKPFSGESFAAVSHNILYSHPVPPHTLNVNVGEFLSNVVLKALSKDPAQRFEDGEVMAAALEGCLKDSPDPMVLESRRSKESTTYGMSPFSVHTPSDPAATRCSPFVRVDEDFYLFGPPLPFPSRQEYFDGLVPAFSVEAEVQERLKAHGWAFLQGVASVGKTTLALRIATTPEQRTHAVYYLDLAKVADYDPDAKALPALRLLAHPSTLLILDNVNHDPEFARALWDEWRFRPPGSRLLLIATQTEHTAITTPSQGLEFFESHAINPAVNLRPTARDLGHIVKFLRRAVNPGAPPLEDPPEQALQRWHKDFGGTLGAFCFAALGSLRRFQKRQWELPVEAAAGWVWKKWLKDLDTENHENVRCLAVFGAQELELEVQDEALPHPGRIEQLLKLGLVADSRYGDLRQSQRFSLREPEWGRLILAAQRQHIDEEQVLLGTAVRHLVMAAALSARLQRARRIECFVRLWGHLADNADVVTKQVSHLPLSIFQSLIKAARTSGQNRLADKFWEAIEEEPHKLVARAWETPLDLVGSFLNTATRHGRDTSKLWKALERGPEKLAARAWETPLDGVGSFLDTAKRHGRDM